MDAVRIPARRWDVLTLLRLISIGIGLVFLSVCVPARAATFTVTNLNDSGAGSLRDAFTQSNITGGTNAITFSAGLTGTITLTSGALLTSNNNNVSVVGPGANVLTVSGNNASRVFDIRIGTTFSVSGLTIANGRSDYGAGISNDSGHTVTVTNCVISGNGASVNGGGINNNSGSLNATHCTFSGNTANTSTGYGSGLLTVSGSAVLNYCTFSNNSARIGAGVVNYASLEMNGCTVTSNSAYIGAGIYNNTPLDGADGTVTLSGCTVSNNSAGRDGGGIYSNGTLTLTACTISGNGSSRYGGGAIAYHTATVSNCTFSGNSALYGGGIDNEGTLIVRSSTFSGNTANSFGGDIINFGPLTLRSSIFNDTASDSIANIASDDTYPTVTDEGFNLARDAGGGVLIAASDKLNVDPVLGPLASNGGPTQTHALLAGSPAIDSGNSSGATDQRGNPRRLDLPGVANAPGSDGSDIGAFELDLSQTGGTLVVNTLADHDDGVPGIGDCTLREAIHFAPDGGMVTFAAGLTGTITLGGIELLVNKSLTIMGPGAKFIFVSGNNASRVLRLAVPNFGTINVSGLTITQGRANSGGGINVTGFGTLNLLRCALTANTASGSGASGNGGGLYNADRIVLTVDSCTFSGNSAESAGGLGGGGGGALYQGTFDAASVSNSTFSGNVANYGGAILNNNGGGSSVSVGSCTFSGNSANPGGRGGGIYHGFYGLRLGNNIFNDTVGGSVVSENGGTVTDDGFNLARDGGGGVLTAASDKLNIDPFLDPLQDNGGPTPTHALAPGSPAIDAGKAMLATDQRGVARPFGAADDIGAFEYSPDPTGTQTYVVTTAKDVSYADGLVSLREAITAANGATGSAPTITFSETVFGAPRKMITLTAGSLPAITRSLTITGPAAGVTVSGQDTGRVFRVNAGIAVTFNGLTITNGGNTDRGGGVLNLGTLRMNNCTVSGNRADDGGGIFNDAGASLRLTACTVSGNATTYAYGKGGGVHNAGNLRVENSSIGGGNAYFAAAIYNAATTSRTVALDSCTLAFNQAFDCGGIINDSATAVDLVNTLIASNSNTGGTFNRADVAGEFTGLYVLISNGDGGSGFSAGSTHSQIGTSGAPINALLGTLADNGGPTPTFALLPGSPAIDTGSTGFSIDQRGVARPQRNADDIGAFERQNSAPAAGADSLTRYAGQSASVSDAALLANDADPEGDGPLTIVALTAPTSGQATVSRANGYVFYDPAPGFNGADTFTYQVSDSRGAVATATVAVTVSNAVPPVNATTIALESVSGGGTQARLTFSGLAGRTYRVQYTDNLAAPTNWITLPGSGTANAQGHFEIIDTFPSPRPTQRFYRSTYPEEREWLTPAATVG